MAEFPSSSAPPCSTAAAPFVIPLAIESLYAQHCVSEVTLRRFMASIDENYLRQRNLPMSYLKGSSYANNNGTTGNNNTMNASAANGGGGGNTELPALNEVTQSLRDHATAALTPCIVRLGYLLAHLFNVRYCKVVAALHPQMGVEGLAAMAVGMSGGVRGSSNDPCKSCSGGGTAAVDQQQNAVLGCSSSSPTRSTLDAGEHQQQIGATDLDGPAGQETCLGSRAWLEDLQLCAQLAAEGRLEVVSSAAGVSSPTSAATPSTSATATATTSTTITSASMSAVVTDILRRFVVFGPHSWVRILPAAINLAGKLQRVMIRRHVMRFCVLDTCQRVAGRDVTVPAPCAWETQLQSYEIAMVELLSSQRLADQRLPEGYLRVLLWQFQQFAAMSDGIAGDDDNLFTPKRRGLFPATGVLMPAAASTAATSNPDGTNVDVPPTALAASKFTAPFKEDVQMGALAILSFCYRSTELLLYGSHCTVRPNTNNNYTNTNANANASQSTSKNKGHQHHLHGSNAGDWDAATQKGSFAAGLLSRYTGEGCTYDVAVMALVAAASHTLVYTCGVDARTTMKAIREGFWAHLIASAKDDADAFAAIVRKDGAAVCEPPTPSALEAYFEQFIATMNVCLHGSEHQQHSATPSSPTGPSSSLSASSGLAGPLRRDPPSANVIAFLSRVCKL